ncbi:MAG: molybdopterin-dependent oxidoreductase [Candidatus Humimicrobiaceae bacterium]
MKKLIVIFISLLIATVFFVGCKTTVAKSETASNVTIKTADVVTTTKTASAATTAAETTTTVAETTTKANEPAPAGWTITISGINSKDVNFTDADAAKMSATEITVSNKKNDGSAVEQKWTGIPLKTILDFYGANDYDGVKVEASDGTISDLDMAAVSDPGTVLGLKLDGQTLSTADGLASLIVKSQMTKSLIKEVVKITIKG